jgi:hypothetical protein
MNGSEPELTRDEACDAFDISSEAFDRIVQEAGLEPGRNGRYEPMQLAAAAIRYARRRAEITDGTLHTVGACLSEAKPALERLAELADRSGLSGEAHRRATREVAAFFTAFAEVMNRATAALKAGEENQA